MQRSENKRDQIFAMFNDGHLVPAISKVLKVPQFGVRAVLDKASTRKEPRYEVR